MADPAFGNVSPPLEVLNLHTQFFMPHATVKAVDGISLKLSRGHTLAVVGESGSGKSVLARSMIDLIEPPGRIISGSVTLGGRDLLHMSSATKRQVRGDRIAMIYQNPGSALDPLETIGAQLRETLRAHKNLPRVKVQARASEALELAAVPDVNRILGMYPHELSGGMLQRITIAMAISCSPDVLIADEPTTNLDVTTQAQILVLLSDMVQRLGLAVLLITHDMGVVAQQADEVLVMYAGRCVESGPVRSVLEAPLHPYTSALINCVPDVESTTSSSSLFSIPGSPPDLSLPQVGCSFAPRCPLAGPKCFRETPELRTKDGERFAACFVAEGRDVNS